jgi:hypothetical protein
LTTPGIQNDKKQRQDFQKDFSIICKAWKFDKGLDKLILKRSELLEGEKLGEYFEIVRRLFEYTDIKKYPYLSGKDTRKACPRGGRQVALLFRKEMLEPGTFRTMTLCYVLKNKRIYDFLFDDESIFKKP